MADIQMMAIDKIKCAPFNPPNRVEEQKLKQLRDSIQRVGMLHALLVTSENELFDGHRRLACAKALGWAEVPVTVHDGDLESLWKEVNAYTATIRPATWWQAVAYGLNLEHVPSAQRKLIQESRKWIEVEESNKIAIEHSKSTDVIRMAINVARYIEEDSDEMKGRILKWLVKHEMSFNVHNYMVGRQPSELIRDAILADKPITRGWAII